MKRLFTSVLSFLMAFSLWAEAPQTISYQAVVRNNQGRLLRETNVGVRITILQEHENGHSVYTETRTVKTNVNGLMTFAIGDANGITSDTLSNIAWADNSYFLRCDIDLDGGENYTLSSTSQMNSVPYALYAKNIAPEALPTWAQSEDKPVYNYSEIQDAPEVPTKVSDLENDANYITLEDVKQVVSPTKMSQMENDADYAKKSDIPSLEGYVSTEYASIAFQPKGNYITEAEASSMYQPKGNYLTEHQSLADYAKKTDIPAVPSNVSSFTNDAGYLTEHQSLADYAKKSELPSTAGLLSEAKAAETYQPKGNYLTEHQSLAGYATKSELPKADSLLSKAEASTTYQPKGNYLTEHQSLADYAKKSELPSVPTNVSSFTNDAGYLTEHQSLADYAKKSELPKKDSLLSKAEASTTYQPKGNYLTEHQSLAAYAKKTDIPAVPTNVSSFTNDAGYLTEHQSLADYAKKSELPKADSLLSKSEASATYQPKGNYLTEHQSLADYAKKSELPSVPTNVSSFTNDAGYLTEHQSLADYAKKSDLPKKDSLLSKSEASTTYQPKGNYLTEHQSLADYAKKTDIPTVPTNVSSFTNDAGYLTEHQSLADYAKKSDLPKKDSLLSKAEASTTYQPKGNYLTEHQSLADYAKKTDIPTVPTNVSSFTNDAGYLTEHQSLAAYAKKSEIPSVPTKVSSFTNDAGYLTEHQSLADYAKKSDLPKKDSLLSKSEASTTYQPKGNYLTEHQSLADYAKKTDIPTVPTNVSSFTNDAGYLTEHQSLADYAKKSELLSVPTKVSDLTNDAGYLTEHQSLADYAKKSDLPKKDSLLSKAEASTTYQPKGNYLTEHQSLADYAKKSEIPSVPTKVSSFTNDAGYLTEHQSLANYAKKSDLPKKDSLLSKAEASTTYQPKGNYLTEHQSLAAYAKKTDIPTVPTKVSSFTNDANYITKATFDGIVADYNTLLDKYKKDLDSLKAVMESMTDMFGVSFDRIKIESGCLSGLFSISEYTKIKFSMGNLQYNAALNEWRFAEEQTEFIGDDNNNVSPSYDGWIDRFGWGTSGWNSGAKAYQPYSVSKNDNDYFPGNNVSNDLTGKYANADWGVYNAITNGGNEIAQWRTLTADEWSYLLFKRPNASSRYTCAIIDNITGFILLPDEWKNPIGVNLEMGLLSGGYSKNVISIEQWYMLEKRGAVFLPTFDGNLDSFGIYWTSSHGSTINPNNQTLLVQHARTFRFGFEKQSSSWGTYPETIPGVTDEKISTGGNSVTSHFTSNHTKYGVSRVGRYYVRLVKDVK